MKALDWWPHEVCIVIIGHIQLLIRRIGFPLNVYLHVNHTFKFSGLKTLNNPRITPLCLWVPIDFFIFFARSPEKTERRYKLADNIQWHNGEEMSTEAWKYITFVSPPDWLRSKTSQWMEANLIIQQRFPLSIPPLWYYGSFILLVIVKPKHSRVNY